MPKLPVVAIIGRPNTGKSTLFNRLVGRRKAIVSDTPGTTRDQVAHRVEGEKVDYVLLDTGGMGGGTQDTDLEDDVQQQSLLALEHADLIIFTINSTEELTSSDFACVDTLRKNKRKHVPVILALTKCDNPEKIDGILPQYFALGIADHIVATSAPHKIGIEDLESTIVEELLGLHFQKDESGEAEEMPKIAIIGKPNVGKSSIVNALMSEPQRKASPLLVSDIPGTTRDAIDTVIRFHEKDYLFIDTAGLKRQKQTRKSEMETFASFRSIQVLEHCDICVLILDATQPVSKQDKRIAAMANEEGKGLIVLLNKMDQVSSAEKEHVLTQVQNALLFCRYAPLLVCSAVSKEGLLSIFPLIESVHRNRSRRIPTHDLHRWFREAVSKHPMGALASAKHITQAEEIPPTFVVFVKNAKHVRVSQLRTLDNAIRKTYAFEGTPLRWVTKEESR